MRSHLLLRRLLRSAVAEALAVSCSAAAAATMCACGGAVESSPLAEPPADAAPSDSARGGDSGLPEDASRPDTSRPDASQPDTALQFDVGLPDTFSTFDAEPPDTAPADAPIDDDGSCGQTMAMPCGSVLLMCIPAGMAVGYNMGSACTVECGMSNFGCEVAAMGTGFTVQCLCGGGRYPAGLTTLSPGTGSDPVGRFLAQGAALEAAAVRAFEQLTRELGAHEAPADLVRRARRAARQEAVHARLLRKAAAARGCKVPRMRSHPTPAAARSLLELATENAAEGCGRETIGAALLDLQSRRSTDPTLRSIFARIAADELEHAALAWDLQAWLESKLDAGARSQVQAARGALVAACQDHVRLPDAAAAVLGWPSAQEWRALVAAVERGCVELAA